MKFIYFPQSSLAVLVSEHCKTTLQFTGSECLPFSFIQLSWKTLTHWGNHKDLAHFLFTAWPEASFNLWHTQLLAWWSEGTVAVPSHTLVVTHGEACTSHQITLQPFPPTAHLDLPHASSQLTELCGPLFCRELPLLLFSGAHGHICLLWRPQILP